MFSGDALLRVTLPGLIFIPKTQVFISSIINAGGKVQAYDPVVNEEVINKFPKQWFTDKKLVLMDDNYIALENSDALVLLTEWKMFRNPNLETMKNKMKYYCIFDGRNQYDPQYMKKNGFDYKGIGR